MLYYSIIKDRFQPINTKFIHCRLSQLGNGKPLNYFKSFPFANPLCHAIKSIRGSDKLFCHLASDFWLLKMVEVNGIEPMTSCVQGRRSPS